MGEPLNHILQDTKSARLITVCKRSLKQTVRQNTFFFFFFIAVKTEEEIHENREEVGTKLTR